jgi:hypothetical protein
MSAKMYTSWTDLELMVDAIVYKIRTDKYEPTLLVGLSRGGLVAGVMLSHRLNIEFIPLRFSTRDFVSMNEDTIEEICDMLAGGNTRLLVIDDICDSGKTFLDLRARLDEEGVNLENVKWASLHLRETAQYKPDYFAQHLTDDSWIVYPYEAEV